MGSTEWITTSRSIAALIGPELYWAIVYVPCYLMASQNHPPTPGGNAWLERMWYLLPLVAIPSSYFLYLAPNAGRWWLLLRINLAALIGLTFCLHIVTSAIDYSDSRNSGVLAGFLLGLGLGLMVLATCDVATAVRLMLTRRADEILFTNQPQ